MLRERFEPVVNDTRWYAAFVTVRCPAWLPLLFSILYLSRPRNRRRVYAVATVKYVHVCIKRVWIRASVMRQPRVRSGILRLRVAGSSRSTLAFGETKEMDASMRRIAEYDFSLETFIYRENNRYVKGVEGENIFNFFFGLWDIYVFEIRND